MRLIFFINNYSILELKMIFINVEFINRVFNNINHKKEYNIELRDLLVKAQFHQ